MTDQELLRLAAPAAGAKWTDYSDRTPDQWISKHADGIWRPWNPLTDDGDALRLAVALDLTVHHYTETGEVGVCLPYCDDEIAMEWHGQDKCAATRRAIVRAAAALALDQVPLDPLP